MMINQLVIWLRPVRSVRSYVNLFYLLTVFLLGSGYLLFLTSGFALSLATLPILLGMLFTQLMILALQKLAILERSLTQVWLKVTIPPPQRLSAETKGVWRRFLFLLKSPETWKNLTYVLVKALVGTVSSGIVLSFLLLSLLLFFGSLAYLIDIGMVSLFQIQPFSETALAHLSFSIIVPLTPFAGLDSLPLALELVRLCLTALLGPVLFVGVLHLGNGLATFWGQFAARMLSASQSDLQLAEARRLAEQERAKAEQADQKRRELITNVSHELRTPIASIQGHVESLLKACRNDGTLPSPEILPRYLTIVHRELIR